MGRLFNPEDYRVSEVDLRTPTCFVRSIGLKPTVLQTQIIEKFEVIHNFTSICDGRQEIARAFAIGILWQTISSRGSKSTIISSDMDLGKHVMGFLRAAIQQGPQDLRDVCNFPSTYKIQFGPDPGWNLVLLKPSEYPAAAARGAQTRAALVLKENSSEISFVEAKDALLNAMTHKARRIFHLW